MLSKKEIKDIQSLGLKKHRDETSLFVAEGPKIVRELYQLIPSRIKRVYAVPEWIEEAGEQIPASLLTAVTESELESISQLKTPHKALALVSQVEAEEPVVTAFGLYLDTIQDPGNFGTILRIADWFGIENIVCSTGCADLYNPKVVQSTMASLARVRVYYDGKGDWLSKQQVPVFAATLQGKSLYDFEKTSRGILLIGNESRGLKKELMDHATAQLTIPRKGKAESLNAAVATGIILSHLLP
ncbi:MAG: TrmH family RNA methyltransferase [Flavisolibacter sp.]